MLGGVIKLSQDRHMKEIKESKALSEIPWLDLYPTAYTSAKAPSDDFQCCNAFPDKGLAYRLPSL